MSFTNRRDGKGRHAAPDQATIASIPLSDVDVQVPGQESIGSLVRDATTQMSTLVRAEVELAKAEVTDEVKKGLQGSVFFLVALTVLLFSTFFFFFFLAELLNTWVWRWLAFLIVFLIMVVITGVFALLGYLRVRRLRAPEKTIDSLKAARTVLPTGKSDPAQWDVAPGESTGKHSAKTLNR
ncbi:phage holin family protein [Skermania piniformis]|uniref:Phage holin family protein n=1 Tax=Skermania pinensis TaxID=39122 RepID=A0ABX8S8Q5_9ACTN|nr:phage holin family protein [Skermania piniformis]QXQ14197.1 phage holin family protein [Skermania piniformis]